MKKNKIVIIIFAILTATVSAVMFLLMFTPSAAFWISWSICLLSVAGTCFFVCRAANIADESKEPNTKYASVIVILMPIVLTILNYLVLYCILKSFSWFLTIEIMFVAGAIVSSLLLLSAQKIIAKQTDVKNEQKVNRNALFIYISKIEEAITPTLSSTSGALTELKDMLRTTTINPSASEYYDVMRVKLDEISAEITHLKEIENNQTDRLLFLIKEAVKTINDYENQSKFLR